MEHYRVHIRKEELKFSAAHMTVYPDGTKEALHGHNYRTEISFDLADVSLNAMIDFSIFKKAIRQVSGAWDEKVLLAKSCPFMKDFRQSAGEIEFKLCGKRYVLPADEVVLLPLDNITTETLAEQFCKEMIEKLDPKIMTKNLMGIQVCVEEISGQGATYFWTATKI